jgi:hypothetical protein
MNLGLLMLLPVVLGSIQTSELTFLELLCLPSHIPHHCMQKLKSYMCFLYSILYAIKLTMKALGHHSGNIQSLSSMPQNGP